MECEKCQGTGFIRNRESRTYRKCSCRLKEEAYTYLTPLYKGATWLKGYDISILKDNPYLLFFGPVPIFNNWVKTFLLETGMQYTHLTVYPYEIADRKFGEEEEVGKFTELTEVEFLILILNDGMINKEYGNLLVSLLDTRILMKKRTWVYSTMAISDKAWIDLYTSKLAAKLREEFRQVPLA